MAEALALALLVGVLGFAVTRPRGLPEAVAAVPAALLLLVTRVLSWHAAAAEVRRLLPVVLFLGAVLVLAELCAEEGLFAAAGAAMAARCRGSAARLLLLVFAAAALTTAVLSLDTTVVLLTPVVVATAGRLGVRPRPHLYACTHLANSGSLLLPVSNLTNLLALAALPITFARFAALMALPWLVVLAVEYAAFRRFFARDLAVPAEALPAGEVRWPRTALAVVALTLAGFVGSSFVGVAPAWVAGAGAAVLAARRLAHGGTSVVRVARSAGVPFLVFVLALGVVVRAVVGHGLGSAVDHLLPAGASLPALLGVAAVAAVTANVVNNLPAVLILLPIAAVGGVGPVLAVLVGVNVGPNLTYAGSLATLLWRRVLHRHGHEPAAAHYLALGALTVPVSLVGAVIALWAALRVLPT